MVMKFDDIIISDEFATHPPAENKIKKCREAYAQGIKDRKLVITPNNMLVDGYVLYLVMKENGYTGDVDVNLKKYSTTYVFGKHEYSDKEYVWYANMSFKKLRDKVGQTAKVETFIGIQPVTITRVIKSYTPPVKGKIRKVVEV